VLAFIGVGGATDEEKYCQACREAGLDEECETCPGADKKGSLVGDEDVG
jgi:hypothetical protein